MGNKQLQATKVAIGILAELLAVSKGSKEGSPPPHQARGMGGRAGRASDNLDLDAAAFSRVCQAHMHNHTMFPAEHDYAVMAARHLGFEDVTEAKQSDFEKFAAVKDLGASRARQHRSNLNKAVRESVLGCFA